MLIWKKTGLKGCVYGFSFNYGAIAVVDILDIHKYLKKKRRFYKMFEFVKQTFVLAMMFFGCEVLAALQIIKQKPG